MAPAHGKSGRIEVETDDLRFRNATREPYRVVALRAADIQDTNITRLYSRFDPSRDLDLISTDELWPEYTAGRVLGVERPGKGSAEHGERRTYVCVVKLRFIPAALREPFLHALKRGAHSPPPDRRSAVRPLEGEIAKRGQPIDALLERHWRYRHICRVKV